MTTTEKWYNKTSSLFTKAKKNIDFGIFGSSGSVEWKLHFKDCLDKLTELKAVHREAKALLEKSEKISNPKFNFLQISQKPEGLCKYLGDAMASFETFQSLVKKRIGWASKVSTSYQRIS